jgi:diguanylate cyclase (GGDEF)-like protein/PAS domain S-box-containing protein
MSCVNPLGHGESHEDRLLSAQRLAGLVTFSVDVGSGRFDHSPGLETLFNVDSCSTTNHLSKIVHIEDRRAVEVFFCLLRVVPRGEPDELEFRNMSGERLINCRAQVEHSSNGHTWIVGALQDVTEFRSREQHLRVERKRLSDAQHVAGIGTWEWLPETQLIELSEITCAITGWPPGSAIPYEAYIAEVPPEDRHRVDQTWRELWRNPQNEVTCEHRYRCANGRTRLLRIHGAYVGEFRAHGRQRMLGTLQDVTEQRAMATRLQRFTALCQVAPIGMAIFDDSKRLVEANDALCDLLGYSLDELHALHASDMTHATDPNTILPSREDNIADSDSTISECTLITRYGHPVHCELHRGLTVHDDGSRYWLLVFNDITERIEQARALQHQATHDELTGLPNRAGVKDMLAAITFECTADDHALLFCDVDNFKVVNDECGHSKGDELLCTLARRLRTHLPKSCTAARLSGDEFLILCSDVESAGGLDQLISTVSTLMRATVAKNEKKVSVTASIGTATTNLAANSDDLLRIADAAMISNKIQRKSRLRDHTLGASATLGD